MILSIIIPVYKIEAYIAQCLDSLICNNSDYEIICIDDGSPDLSGQICDEYASKYPFIKVIHKLNGGVSSARNEGIAQATGKYIYFVDGDDYVEGIDMLIQQLKDKDTEGFILNCNILNSTDAIKQHYEYTKEVVSINKEYAHYKRTFHASWNFIYRKELIIKHHIKFDTQLKYAEDWVFVVHYLSTIKHLHSIKGFTYYYRQERIGSATNTKHTEEQIWKFFHAYDMMTLINPSTNLYYFNNERRKLLSYAFSITKHNIKQITNINLLQRTIRERINPSILQTIELRFLFKAIIAYINIRFL